MAETTQTTQNPDWPFWLPGREEFELLPPGVKVAIGQLIVPLYRQLILEAADPLQKSVGFTLVHLTWLEILDAVELGRDPVPALPFLDVDDRKGKAERHLKLVAAKMRAAGFLLRLEQFRRGPARRAATPPVGQVCNLSPNPTAENEDSVDQKSAGGQVDVFRRGDTAAPISETGDFVDQKTPACEILRAGEEDLSLVEMFDRAVRRAERKSLRKKGKLVDQKSSRKRRAKAKRPR